MSHPQTKTVDTRGPTSSPTDHRQASAAIGGGRSFLPLDLAQVEVAGEFGRRIGLMIEANILTIDIEQTFLNEFRNRGEGGYLGLGKFIDAVVRLAAGTKDQRLLALKDRAISALLETQDLDGYIGTVKDPRMRIKALWDLHEGAYLIWAFVSDYQCFGKRSTLTAAQRLADYFLRQFAADPQLLPDGVIYPMPLEVSAIGLDRALLALGRATGLPKYREFVVDFLKMDRYEPSTECGATTTANHAYSCLSHAVAQTELYHETGDVRTLDGPRKILSFLRHGDGMLITGSCSHWECWHDSQIGLESTSETCAAAYLARLMDAMLQLEGNSLYGDIMERDIYNALFAATSPDARLSRYHTPFEGKRLYDHYGNKFCCANNNKRFLADLRSWMYYGTAAGIAVNLYNSSTAVVTLPLGTTARVEQQTDYPSSGRVKLKIDPATPCRFEIQLRIPRWCQQATVAVNGSPPVEVAGGRFHRIEREWREGDTIELDMPMQWRFVRGRRAQAGRAAVLRGPLLFTFNPQRNPELSSTQNFDYKLLKLNPLEAEPPVRDDALRPSGQVCVIKAWPPGLDYPYAFGPAPRMPLVLTEYPDPDGESIYFMIPGAGRELLVDDELIV
jgi:DUF1680 family protein